MDGQPLSEHDQAQVDAFAAFLKAQPPRPRRDELEQRPAADDEEAT